MKTKLQKQKQKQGKLKQITKKIKKAASKQDSEEIDSDFLNDDIEDNQQMLQSDKSDSELDEDEDNKRLRLAKQILQQTKSELEQKKKNDIDYQAVHINDEDKLINIALQEKLAQKHTLFTPIASKFDRHFKQEYFKGHLRAITSTQFDTFGKSFYSSSKDSSIIRWDIETKKKEFLQREFGKHGNGHHDEVLSLSLNYDGKILASAGKDHSVKLWDTNTMKLIETLKHHKGPIYSVKFGLNSNNLASVSCDRTLVLWDASQRTFVDQFFGHKTEANDLDCFNADDFISCGYDRQMIIWKTKFGSQFIFSGHDYSIDCIRALTSETFISGSVDGSLCYWNTKKRKALNTIEKAHGEKWITALGSEMNSDFAISGSNDGQLNFYKFEGKQIEQFKKIESRGIINNINIQNDHILTVESQEHRLGRWITDTKAKNQIVLYI